MVPELFFGGMAVEKDASVLVNKCDGGDVHDAEFRAERLLRMIKKPESLGGHVSKAHPGKSLIYAKKIERRTEREPDRRLLAEAKEIVLK